jgi:hypothetical protein
VAAGEAFTTTLVFDLPPGVEHPRLVLTEGPPAERAPELFLIGDEDSFLHRKTVFAL